MSTFLKPSLEFDATDLSIPIGMHAQEKFVDRIPTRRATAKLPSNTGDNLLASSFGRDAEAADLVIVSKCVWNHAYVCW